MDGGAFGLFNAPKTFMRLMILVLQAFFGICVVAYFEDILIYNKDRPRHITGSFKTSFGGLKESTTQTKCEEMCVHHVRKEGIRMDPTKTTTLENWPSSASITKTMSFIMCLV